MCIFCVTVYNKHLNNPKHYNKLHDQYPQTYLKLPLLSVFLPQTEKKKYTTTATYKAYYAYIWI